MNRYDEIKARCEAATPGPWKVKVKGNTVESHQVMSPGNGPICSAISPKTKNAQFIAHAREDIPHLLSEVKQLTARAEKAEKEREAAVKDINSMLNNIDSLICCHYCAKSKHGEYCGFDSEGENGELLFCNGQWRGAQEEE